MFLLIINTVPTGLLALQGNDEQGHFIRTGLKKMGVSTQFIKGAYLYVCS